MMSSCCRKSITLFLLLLLLMVSVVHSFRPSPRSHVITSPIMHRRIPSVTNINQQSSVLRSSTNDNNDDVDSDMDGFVWVDTSAATNSVQEPNIPNASRSVRNKYIAVASAIFGSMFFVFQHGQPVNSVALLKAMEKDSMDVQVAMCNGKPTLVDFYADWCESCKVMAPTMRSLEAQYKDRINFITIDGASPRNGKKKKSRIASLSSVSLCIVLLFFLFIFLFLLVLPISYNGTTFYHTQRIWSSFLVWMRYLM